MLHLHDLNVSHSSHGDSIELAWRLTNRGDTAVYTTDLALRVEPGGHVSIAFLPTVRVLPSGVVLLSCALAPLDPHAQRMTSPHAYARRIEPGAEACHRATLTTPLRDAALSRSAAGRPTRGTSLELAVSVIEDVPALEAVAHDLDGVAMWRLSEAAWRLHRVVTAALDRVEIPALGV